MERDITWAKYQEEVNKAAIDYISYIMEKSVFIDIYEDLIKKPVFPQVEFKKNTVSLETIKSNVMSNTEDFLNGVNLDVKWLEKDVVEKLRYKYAFDAHRHIMESAYDGSIFDIPLVPSKQYSSYVDQHLGMDEDFRDVVFKCIGIIIDDDGDILESTYFHELVHALISRNWYMITNPLFDEYLPHLLEMFYNYSIIGDEVKYIKKLLIKMQNRTHSNLLLSRDHSFIGLFSKDDLMYTLALILACITFEKYIDFNKQDKDEMEKDIKDVLNGIITVEEFMKKYEVNFDNDSAIKLYKRSVERVQSFTF